MPDEKKPAPSEVDAQPDARTPPRRAEPGETPGTSEAEAQPGGSAADKPEG